MIAGLPATAWLLMLVSVALGLSIELVFFSRYRRARPLSTGQAGSAGSADQTDEPDAAPQRPSPPSALE